MAAIARKIGVFDAAYGPSRFFFGELFASDRTGASPNLGVHAANDTQAAEIGRWLVARDGFDFLLYYLPDVDMAQHKHGPHGALDAVASADRSIASLVEAGGGLDRFLENHGVVLLADHGQTAAREACDVRPALSGLRLFVSSLRSAPGEAQVAVAASNRVCMLYRLADAPASRDLAGRVGTLPGVDLAAFCEDGDMVLQRDGAELRFRRGGPLRDRRGNRVDGDGRPRRARPRAGRRRGRRARLPERAGAGRRACSSASTPARSSARRRRGFEFVDGGGSHHVGGGSHGSLSADDSVVPLITVGVDASQLPGEPSITDAYGLVQRHFGL